MNFSESRRPGYGSSHRGERAPPLLIMFFRQKKSPSGQCLQLLESYRNGQGQPRQHVVVSLGDLTLAQVDRALIARLVEQRLRGQTQLQCLSDNAGATIDGVMPDLITHTHTTPLGPTLVGWQAWQRLGMPELLGQLGFNRAQEQAAATSVINRLIDPGSELALVDWLPNSSLPELMAMEIGPAAKDRFYVSVKRRRFRITYSSSWGWRPFGLNSRLLNDCWEVCPWPGLKFFFGCLLLGAFFNKYVTCVTPRAVPAPA